MNEPLEFVPYHRPSIGPEEIDEVTAALRSGWLTAGPRTAQFEREFCAYAGAPFGLAVNSWTSGAHLALLALGVGPGDEVITTPLTFCATVNTILHTGARAVLADVDKDGNIDPDSIAGRIGPRTKGIIPVHLGGLPCRMDEIWQLAKNHDLFVFEDAAHAVGTRYGDRMVGDCRDASLPRSDAVGFSFYATKNLTTGEGGMITTFRETLAERMRILCLHGISKDAWNRYAEKGNWYYEVVECGFKYNLNDILSAVGIHQLRKQEKFLKERTRLAGIYDRQFAGIDELEIPSDATNGRHAWHLYMLRLRLERLSIDRAEFINQLKQRGIGASVHFIPIPLHPYFAEYAGLPENQCPRALDIYPRLVSLPIYPGLTEEQAGRVIGAVKDIVRHNRRRSVTAFEQVTGAGRREGR